MDIVPLGDRALRFPLPEKVDRRELLATLRARPEFVDVVLTEELGAVIVSDTTPLDQARTALAVALALALAPAPAPAPAPAAAHHLVHVAYDGEDLPALAARLGVTTDAIIAMHTSRDYEVAMVGFLPGFAYLRGLDPRLVLPRREHPRTRVPAGSVAIAAGYTGIYPFASPGGWHLLGQAIDRRRPFDASGAAFAVGDRVRFERAERRALTTASTGNVAALDVPPAIRGAHLEVRKVAGLTLVVDRGRIGHMHEGVPHGGPMVPEAYAKANAAAGNAGHGGAGAAALEVFGALEVTARGGRVVVADDVRGRKVLDDGETFAIATEGIARVRYLAVVGGVDVPVVLGGRGTLLAAGMGGFGGRGLKRGDRVGVGSESGSGSEGEGESGSESKSGSERGSESECECGYWVGPDRDGRVEDAIAGASFVISAASDRTGTRLDGPTLPAHCMHSAQERKSAPMVRGAIEVTPRGLVVLGPDHPTTGGYPIIGVLRSSSIGRFFRLPIGARVRLLSSTLK